jgi:hypothetical protein
VLSLDPLIIRWPSGKYDMDPIEFPWPFKVIDGARIDFAVATFVDTGAMAVSVRK